MNIRRYIEPSYFLRSPDEPAAPVTTEPVTTTEEPVVAADEPVTEPATTTEEPATTTTEPAVATPPAKDGAQKRIDALTAEKWAERRQREAAENRANLLQQQLDAARTNPPTDADEPAAPRAPATQPVTQQTLAQMAQDIANNNAFQATVVKEIETGRSNHSDFDQVAQNLQKFGELPRTFVEAVVATERGSDVLYHLGQNVAEADRILSLPPMAQAVALAKLADTIAKPAPAKIVSSAPAPIAPKVGGTSRNTPSITDPDIPIADFIKMRDKQIADSKKSGTSARR